MNDSKIILCGDFLPDLGCAGTPGTAVAQNVLPRSKTSYSPMPSFVVSATSALNGKPLGAFSAVDASGNAENYVGTVDKLYAMRAATKPNFSDASATTYATPTGNYWSFAEADGYVFAANGSDKVQVKQVAASGSFANHSDTRCPTARYAAYIQPGFLLLGDINDPTVGIQPQGLRWSVLGDARSNASFPLVGSADAIAGNSDWQKVSGAHGRMRGIAPDLTSCNAAIFFERAIFRMIFTGTETIFAIQPVENASGTPSPRAIAQRGPVCYFLGWDGFYAFDGTTAVPIGTDRVNKTFFADVDSNYLNQVASAVDPTSGLIFWSYAGAGNSNGVPNRIVVYSPELQKFTFITDPTGNNLFIARTLGTTLENVDALGFNLDNLPYSLDSDFFTGGNIALGGFDSTFKYGAFTGPSMAFTVDTMEAQLLGGRKARVSSARPVVEGDYCNVAIAGRQVLSSGAIYDVGSSPDENGNCPARNESRYHRARLYREAGSLVTHIKGAELFFSPGAHR